MRQILFRGKDHSATWRYGSYIENAFGSFIIKCLDNAYVSKSYKVDQKSLGEYVGLTDKNGVKIFEGDILQLYDSEDECFGFVKYDGDLTSWVVTIENTDYILGDYFYKQNIVVVGNVYDNSELLEEEA